MNQPKPESPSTPCQIPVPLLDIARENGPLAEPLRAAIDEVINGGRFVLGPAVESFEAALAAHCGTQHAVGCASGSDALLLALMAEGIGPGDEVLLPSFTFFATASAVWRLGARPVFVDIEPATFNIDPQHAAACVTGATRAIIPVHLFGQCADMGPLCELARRHSLTVIEDAAQSIGAEYHCARAGSLGHVGCLSFYPTKNLGGFGDAGALVTNDERLAGKLCLLRGHGMAPRYHHREVGINSRLDSLQAAVLSVKLDQLDAWTSQREQNAARYGELFAAQGLEQRITLPVVDGDRKHVWNQYTIRVGEGRRDALRKHLAERNIGSEVYYPVPLHEQQCFVSLGYAAEDLPHTHAAAGEVLSLPIFPQLTAAEQETVVAAIAAFYRPRVSAPKFQSHNAAASQPSSPTC